MTLTLEIMGAQAAQLGGATRKVFANAGGSIGRMPDNDWVIADPYISGRHARVHFRNGQYLLEDTSSNGVFLNSPNNRLPRGELHPLKSGDRIFIDAYEIHVTLAAQAPSAASSPLADLFAPAAAPASPPPMPADPFSADPFGPAPTPPRSASKHVIPDDFTFGVDLAPASQSDDAADPLKALGLESKRPSGAAAPRAQDLHGRSPLNDHYAPPAPRESNDPPARDSGGGLIPDGYDPLLDDLAPGSAPPVAKPTPPPRPSPGQRIAPAHVPPPPEPASAAPPRPSAPAQVGHPPQANAQFDFTAMLAGAGLEGVQVTPELAENFGRIMRTVVAGLMDVLRAREQIKNEFRMRMTTFKQTDNNPLKFSANVEDALHNLLVKRNSAYLGPAEAFEDAFQDVRNHQMAMLAGVRVAFEAMMNEFDPERMQEVFDRQLKKGSLISAPARLRYWELYCDKFRDMVKDPENNFRELFGDEFARAYEEQLQSLKAADRVQRK